MATNQVRYYYLVAVLAAMVLLLAGGGAGAVQAQAATPTATHTPIPTRTPTLTPVPSATPMEEVVHVFGTPVGVLEHRITDGERVVSYLLLALILAILFLAVVVMRMDTNDFIFVAFAIAPPIAATAIVFLAGLSVLWLADLLDDLEWL
jgi:hypothetical protein